MPFTATTTIQPVLRADVSKEVQASFDGDHFFWSHTEEPHRTRRQAIIKAHPEVLRFSNVLICRFRILMSGLGTEALRARALDQILRACSGRTTAAVRLSATRRADTFSTICIDGLHNRCYCEPESFSSHP